MTDKSKTFRIPVRMQHKKWKAIWSQELLDALKGSGDAMGTELMMEGRFRIEFDNDDLTCWMILKSEPELECPKCGSDEIEKGVEDLERKTGVCLACGHWLLRSEM